MNRTLKLFVYSDQVNLWDEDIHAAVQRKRQKLLLIEVRMLLSICLSSLKRNYDKTTKNKIVNKGNKNVVTFEHFGTTLTV